jgi:hypothetical protein
MKKKIKTVIEGIFLIAFFAFASAVDSPNMLVPVIGVLVSLLGMVITSRLEV